MPLTNFSPTKALAGLAALAAVFAIQPFTASTAHALCVTGVAYNDVLNMRSRPTSRSPIVGAIRPGRCGVRFVERSGNWMFVRYRGQQGWVNSRFISDRDEGDGGGGGGPIFACVAGVRFNDVLNVRRRPTVNSSIVGVLRPNSCRVRILDYSGNWRRISKGPVVGWVNGRFLDR
ncbi:MAG: SH3 domain-containing protein [Pseudomonadota bacterium]